LNRERKNQPDRQHKGTDVAKMKVGNDSHINGTDDDDDDSMMMMMIDPTALLGRWEVAST